ncbi:MAG TPA: Ig-like domain-containing protein [Gemmatimonadales bacterium]
MLGHFGPGPIARALLVTHLAIACGDSSGPPERKVDVSVGSVTIGASQDTLILGSQLQINAVVKEVSDTVLPGWPLRWTTSDTTLAVVSLDGLVTPVRPGTVRVIATSDSGAAVADTLALRLLPRVAALTITPRPGVLILSDSVQLFAVVTDSTGAILPGRPIQWGSGGNGVVRADGTVRAVAGGSVLVTATAEGRLDSLRIPTNVDAPFVAIAAGDQHTCAITSSGRAYCWGDGFVGQLGDSVIQLGLSPIPIDPALRFAAITASGSHTCARTASSTVYCWGYNSYGQVGTSADRNCGYPCRAVDTVAKVAALPAIATVFTGFEFSCATTAADEAWCWGKNEFGQLGRGTSDLLFNPIPDTVRALGPAHSFVGGYGHSCAISAGGIVQCWGTNTVGQLGRGTVDTLPHLAPAPIAGGLAFVQLTAGQAYTCGLTTGHEAWCWGQATDGKLGSGTVTQPVEPSPLRVAGNLTWLSISANADHTCGITTTNKAYCWGNSSFLATGNIGGPTPQPVNGNLAFIALAAGHYHTCGITTTGTAYCWGTGIDGELGNNSEGASGVPAKVVGQP